MLLFMRECVCVVYGKLFLQSIINFFISCIYVCVCVCLSAFVCVCVCLSVFVCVCVFVLGYAYACVCSLWNLNVANAPDVLNINFQNVYFD